MVVGIGEAYLHPRSGSDPHQNFSRNRRQCRHHISEELHEVLVGSTSSNAVRGGVFEHDHDFRRRRRSYRESEGDMERGFCSETEPVEWNPCLGFRAPAFPRSHAVNSVQMLRSERLLLPVYYLQRTLLCRLSFALYTSQACCGISRYLSG